MTWDEVGVKHGTDKSSIGHDYLRHYERALEGHDVRSVLEIGVDTGASLRTWYDIFPDADVWGIDIRPECDDADVGRAAVLIADATDGSQMGFLPTFDFIIDDGSHQLPDAFKSINLLVPHLEAVPLEENIRRSGLTSFAAVNLLKTHCPQGHPYDEENTKWYEGRRYCRACHNEDSRRRRAAQ